MNLSKVIIFALLLGAYSVHAEYSRPLNWDGNVYKVINKYNQVHKKFFKQVCKPSDQPNYNKLIKQYRGQGFYLPKLNDDIDRKAIIKNLHHFRKKIKFISNTVTRLKKQKSFPKYNLLTEEVDKIIENLLNLKKKYHLSLRKDVKNEVLRQSKLELVLLKKQFTLFMDQLFFLKSFNFPNNYLAHRENYEKYKDKEGIKNKHKANSIFFYRRIIEDGAYDPNRTRPDKSIRTALDTLFLSIQKEKDFISENVRYDFRWIERNLKSLLDRGKKVQLSRLKEWKLRTKSNFEFYQELISTKNKNKAKFLVKKENDASSKLKSFVYRKQAEVYNFWAKQSELHKAMFSLETILVHEVGVIDGVFGLERTNVGMVVLNRYFDDFYNQLEKDQQLTKYISKEINTEKEKWLNVLFKVGEFSFTYHYISAVSGIFCPDMSRRGKGIRNKNLKISLQVIKKHDGSFKAFRYFSRISMLGKIDMSSVWTRYARLPEMAGYKSSFQRKLVRYYYADKYHYYYSFVDQRKIKYTVVKIKNKVYSMRWTKGKPEFYDYRNPHLFAYFTKKY